MCGIIGLINLNQNKQYDEQIKSALCTLSSRGPNHQDIKTYGNVKLGHTRLSILDLSHQSDQPMEYSERYALVYNGEIYNYKELREELKSYGFEFKTSGDTEVLLKAYVHWGKDCVSHFDGMWAFALYDKQAQELFCSRDYFGIKPFYYYHSEDLFVFSSEIKAILEFVKTRKVNYDVIVPFIARGIVDFSEMTFFKEIYRLLPSHHLSFDLNVSKFTVRKYYNLTKKDTDGLSHQDVYSLLENSVRLRLRSNVKIGTCLSGGLDSSCITAIAHKLYGGYLEAIHAKSSAIRNDESVYAQKVARYLGIKLHTIEPTHEQFWKNVDAVIYTQDEPFGSTSIFMQYFVMQKANEIGCTVMLDGQGADEVFLGYENYLWHIYLELKKNKAFNEEDFFQSLKLFRTNRNIILENAKKINNFEKIFKIIKNGNFADKCLKEALLKKLLSRPVKSFDFQKKEIFSRQMQALLRYEDRNSMHFSVETRLPYLDRQLVENVVNMSIEEKFNHGYLKYILRQAIEKQGLLPKDIVWRYNKIGFESPQDEWIEIYKESMIQEIEDSTLLKSIFTKIEIKQNDFLWKLFCIARWEKIFNVKV